MGTTAIHCGKRGSGKTVAGVKKSLDSLREWDVVVFSNVHFKAGECQAYLGSDVNILGRIRQLTPDQLATWWRCRVPYWEPGEVPSETVELEAYVSKPKPGKDQHPDRVKIDVLFTGRWMRVVYLIDEINLIFNSRNWMKHGEEVTYWDQHAAKLGDRMIYCYPNFKTLDCGLRDMADEVWNFWNGGLRNLNGLVKSPDKLFWRRYDGTTLNKESLVETGTTPKDPKLFACYETRGGLDFVATGERREDRAKGLPWYSLVALPVIISGVIYLGLKAVYATAFPFKKPEAWVAIVQNSVKGEAMPAKVPQVAREPLIPSMPGRSSRVEVVRVKEPEQLRGYMVLDHGTYRETTLAWHSGRISKVRWLPRADGKWLAPLPGGTRWVESWELDGLLREGGGETPVVSVASPPVQSGGSVVIRDTRPSYYPKGRRLGLVVSSGPALPSEPVHGSGPSGGQTPFPPSGQALINADEAARSLDDSSKDENLSD